MNEESKNIETCLAENILAEVASVPTDPQFVSLVNEALDPLQQQALQQAGYDAYVKVTGTHRPYTFTSQVKQMKSNLILLLRRLWRFPFGRGTIRSLADMWQHYITRLSGNETYGIPSRLSQLTDLPSAPSLLSDRTISEPNAIDGISLAQILGNSAAMAAMTAIHDDNEDWVLNRQFPYFPNAALSLKCKTIEIASGITMPMVRAGGDLELPEMTGLIKNGFNTQYGGGILCTDGDKIICPKLSRIDSFGTSWTGFAPFGFDGKLHKCVLGPITSVYMYNGTSRWFGKTSGGDTYGDTTELIHWEFGQGTSFNLDLSRWSATMCLRTDTTASDYVDLIEGSTATNNLQQFLSNFRSFIILRLANRKTTTALTLTLSAAVYNAVTGADSGWASLHTLADLGITDNDLTELETELGITSATIYASWLDTYTGANGIHWDINKAN